MQMHSVKSSNIKEIGHDPLSNVMAVRFNTGALYHYRGVDSAAFVAFHKSDSIGAHFGKFIKGAYDDTRINEEKKEEK